jgi:hypothetical protein
MSPFEDWWQRRTSHSTLTSRPRADPPTSAATDEGGPSEVGSNAQGAVAWRSGGPNVASSQNGSRWTRTVSPARQSELRHTSPRASLR